MVEPGDEIAGAGGDSRLIASQADREQVLDALKAAFVQGRLTKAEFDHRVGQALASYAELDALTADIPAGRTQTRTTEPARESHNRKLIQRGTAAGAGASMVFTAALVTAAGGGPVVGLVVVPLIGSFVAVLLAGLLTLLSWVLEKGCSRRLSHGPPPGPSRRASQRTKLFDFLAPSSNLTRPRYDVRPPSLAMDLEMIVEVVSGAAWTILAPASWCCPAPA